VPGVARKVSSMTVVKVQRPMGPPGGPWLVYTKDRQDFDFCERSVALIAKMEASSKMYCEAELIDGHWVIGKRVEDQDW
jgi:hypothetical protein